MINLVDDHRKAWAKLVGQRKTFRATVKRFGHKHRQGANIKKGATLVLVDVHQKHSKNQIDHVWVNYTPELAQFGEKIRPGALIEFTAVVGTYIKGGKNARQYAVTTFNDLELTDLANVELIKVPYWPKKYEAIVDDELISYVLKTRQNVQSGLDIGADPRGFVKHVYIGQGFCNRFAKTLTWRWYNELPEKYFKVN